MGSKVFIINVVKVDDLRFLYILYKYLIFDLCLVIILLIRLNIKFFFCRMDSNIFMI